MLWPCIEPLIAVEQESTSDLFRCMAFRIISITREEDASKPLRHTSTVCMECMQYPLQASPKNRILF